MTTNPLYAFISKHKATLDQLGCIPKQLSNDQQYFFVPLADIRYTVTILNKKIRLQEHHVSIHSQVDKENAYLSAYHYTAHFVDQDKTPYRLHVYFGDKDEVVKIALSKNTSQDAYEAQDLEPLLTLARSQTIRIIAPCRNLYHKQVKQDVAKFEHLVLELHKISFEHAPLEAKKLLNQILKHLRELIQYYGHAYYRQQYSLYLNRRRKMMDSSQKVQESITSSSSDEDLPIVESKATPVGNQEVILLRPLLEEAKLAHNEYEQVLSSKTAVENKISAMIQAYLSTYTASSFALEKNCKATQEELNQLDKLVEESEKKRTHFFKSLLFQQEYPAAKLFMDGNTEILEPADLEYLVLLALKKDNAPLLNFLLENFPFPIHTAELEHLSPIMYCFKKSLPTPATLECFYLLVKFGADLAEIEPESSLSILDLIYFTPAHLFMPILHRIRNENEPLWLRKFAQGEKTLESREQKQNMIKEIKEMLRALAPKTIGQVQASASSKTIGTVTATSSIENICSAAEVILQKLKKEKIDTELGEEKYDQLSAPLYNLAKDHDCPYAGETTNIALTYLKAYHANALACRFLNEYVMAHGSTDVHLVTLTGKKEYLFIVIGKVPVVSSERGTPYLEFLKNTQGVLVAPNLYLATSNLQDLQIFRGFCKCTNLTHVTRVKSCKHGPQVEQIIATNAQNLARTLGKTFGYYFNKEFSLSFFKPTTEDAVEHFNGQLAVFDEKMNYAFESPEVDYWADQKMKLLKRVFSLFVEKRQFEYLQMLNEWLPKLSWNEVKQLTYYVQEQFFKNHVMQPALEIAKICTIMPGNAM